MKKEPMFLGRMPKQFSYARTIGSLISVYRYPLKKYALCFVEDCMRFGSVTIEIVPVLVSV